MQLYDLDQERIVLSGILAYPDYFLTDISSHLNEKDFYSKESVGHKTVFLRMKTLLDDNKKIDISILSHHLKSLNLSFKDLNTSQFLEALALLSEGTTKEALKQASEVVKLLSIRREMCSVGDSISKKMKTLDSTVSYEGIIDSCDTIYNSQVDLYENSSGKTTNLLGDSLKNLVYERANDRSIFKDQGPPGPHSTLNDLCGSLTKGGQIAVICAGSGVGKTQFTTHYCMYMAGSHKIPILHLDNGEMSEEEIMFRMMSSYSRVPLHLIESGDWADDSSCKEKVEKAIEKIESGNFVYDYYNVGGKNIDETLNYVKRYYYSKIGRGNKLIINYDYLKSSFENNNKFKAEHQVLGESLDKFKKVINKDLKFEGKNPVSLITSVQMNRQGTVGNRTADSVVDDESVIAGSHRIKFYCTHLLILRHKTVDELQWDPVYCGRHLMKIEKGRNFGANYARAENLVEMPDGTHKKNHINFEFDNFKIIDKGDLVSQIEQFSEINSLQEGNQDLDLPI